MTEVERPELASLLDDVRRELGATVDELDRSRAAHRRAESLLLAVLEHVPAPIVVVDEELRVRAASAEAERCWGTTLDVPVSAVPALSAAADRCRAAFEDGDGVPPTLGDHLRAATIDEPGTSNRYIALWAG